MSKIIAMNFSYLKCTLQSSYTHQIKWALIFLTAVPDIYCPGVMIPALRRRRCSRAAPAAAVGLVTIIIFTLRFVYLFCFP